MEMFSHESIVFILDSLVRLGAVAAVLYCMTNVFLALKRGYLYINGKVAKKKDEPFGYWFIIFSWIAVSGIMVHLFFRGL